MCAKNQSEGRHASNQRLTLEDILSIQEADGRMIATKQKGPKPVKDETKIELVKKNSCF